MNKKIGVFASAANFVCVCVFALTMIVNFFADYLFLSYLSSIFIAWSFVAMLCAFAHYAGAERQAATLVSIAFGVMYALCNSLVYFAQLTTVRTPGLPHDVLVLLDFQQYGLFFNFDLLGYCFMAISTLFAGLSFAPVAKKDIWLKRLLLIHGVFALACFAMPTTGVFSTGLEGVDYIGTVIMLFWCAYFAPVGALSFLHFKNKPDCAAAFNT